LDREFIREVGERRIAAMDEDGLDVKVISLTSPGLHNLPADQAAGLQVETIRGLRRHHRQRVCHLRHRWHYESGVQFLRLALAGVFDRFPDLQVLLGHWGEVVLFYLDRADGPAMQAKLLHLFSEYVRRNAFTAGGVYSHRYLRWALEVVGVERILFATDYPYRPGPDGGVEHFLRTAGLDRADQERIRLWVVHAGAPPVGSVEVRTFPALSSAAHSRPEAHESSVSVASAPAPPSIGSASSIWAVFHARRRPE
jgi:hypothetical protein